MLIPHHLNPLPPSRGGGGKDIPLSRVLVTIWQLPKTPPFLGFLPRLRPPQMPPFPEKMGTHVAPFDGSGGRGVA